MLWVLIGIMTLMAWFGNFFQSIRHIRSDPHEYTDALEPLPRPPFSRF